MCLVCLVCIMCHCSHTAHALLMHAPFIHCSHTPHVSELAAATKRKTAQELTMSKTPAVTERRIVVAAPAKNALSNFVGKSTGTWLELHPQLQALRKVVSYFTLDEVWRYLLCHNQMEQNQQLANEIQVSGGSNSVASAHCDL